VRYGISGAPIPPGLPYGDEIQHACELLDFAPCVAYAIKMNETGPDDPPDIISIDGGHGILQLTASYPLNWDDPYSNALYAIAHFLLPAQEYWAALGYSGDNLVRLIAATYNSGLGNAIAAHDLGNVDLYDTDNYGTRCVENVHSLLGT
jgi:hypothetical protein